MYQVRRLNIGKTAQLDELAHTCGELYSQTLVFHCTNKACRFSWHRDGVGACNIRQKYRGEFGVPHVVGGMAPPTGMGFAPHARVAHLARDEKPRRL